MSEMSNSPPKRALGRDISRKKDDKTECRGDSVVIMDTSEYLSTFQIKLALLAIVRNRQVRSSKSARDLWPRSRSKGECGYVSSKWLDLMTKS